MILKRASWLAAAALALATPTWAGTVYVPYAADILVDNIHYETQVWVSNKGTENRRFTSYFINSGTNGANRPNDITYTGITVAGLTTALVTDLAPTGQVGLFEITGAPQLFVSARLIPVGNANLNALGASLPVISDDNLIAANTTAYLQGLGRDGARLTDLAIANLANQATSCSITITTAGGTNIGNPAAVTVPALSLARFTDVFNILGQLQVSGARASVTCDKTFFPYAVIFGRTSAEVNVVSPSAELTSTLVRPGDTPDPHEPGECPQGALCFERPGVFFVPTHQEPYRRESYAVPTGSYSKVHLRMEVFHGGWQSPTSGLHMLFWFAIDRNFKLMGFSAFQGPGKNSVLFRHGVNLTAGDKARFVLPYAANPGETYTIDYVYAPAEHTLELKIFDQRGALVVHQTDRPNVNRINVEDGEDLVTDFSFPAGVNPNEPPDYGWRYQNLTLELFP